MGLFDFVGDAIGSVVGGITGSKKQAKAAQQAGQLQYDAAMKGIGEMRRQFDLSRADQMPWVDAGEAALGGIMDLLGIAAPGQPVGRVNERQAAAIAALEESPLFQSLLRQGEEGILQAGSATGELRGGNIRDVMKDFRTDTLSSVIQQQLANLGGLSGTGVGTAQGLGQLGFNTGAGVSNLIQQGAAAQAGGLLAKGSVNRQAFSDLLKIGSMVF